MAGRVALAVRGFLICVGLEAGVELFSGVRAIGRGYGSGRADVLVPLVIVIGLLGVQLAVVGWAWLRERVGRAGWWVWWVVTIRWVVEAVVVSKRLEWGAGSLMEAWSGLVLMWAGWRVLRGAAGEGEVAADFETQNVMGGARVLAYELVSREAAWVGTGLIFILAMVLGQALCPVVGNLLLVPYALPGWVRPIMFAPLVIGIPTLGILAWRVWEMWMEAKPVGRGLWVVAVWAFVVSMVSIETLLVAVCVVIMDDLGGVDDAIYMVTDRFPVESLKRMGPLVFFVMMVWPGMRGGGGEYTKEGRGEQ